MRTMLVVAAWGGVLAATGVVRADDWPQWMGPGRDGVWRESGIVTTLPRDGAAIRWRAEVGGGYSGPAVADGRVYLMDYVRDGEAAANDPGARSNVTGRERVLCLDQTTGRTLWVHEYACPYSISYASGPRCTPTVAAGRVFALGAEGRLTCLDAVTGAVAWTRSFRDDYGVDTPIWGFSSHPLVDGDRVVCMVGGPGTTVVAFSAATGKEVWRALAASEPGYAPARIVEAAGRRQVLVWDADALSGLEPETGEVLWTTPLKPSFGMSIMAPQVADTSLGRVLFASGIGNVGALFRLDAEKPGTTLLWKNQPKQSIAVANPTPLIVGDTMYGCDCETGFLTAVDLASGRRLWETGVPTMGARRGRHGTAFLVRHGEQTWIFSETGDLILARLAPEGYEEVGRMHLVDPTNECFGREVVWSHPAFAGRCVYARNDREVVCVSLADEAAP